MSYEEYTVKVYSSGTKHWYQNGKQHRTDGPACEWANGSKSWYQNGKLHRTDGPACEYADGSKHWYQNGKLHRTDGPACEWPDGSKNWYLNGKEVTEAEVMSSPKERVISIDGKEYRLVEIDK